MLSAASLKGFALKDSVADTKTLAESERRQLHPSRP